MSDLSGTIGSKTELEFVLMIVSENPQSTTLKVASLTHIGSYHLILHPPRTLHDIYFDTPDRQLGQKRINLRVRGAEGNYSITMKISPRRLSWKRHERQETEIPWAEESLSHVTGELERRGVRLKPRKAMDEHTSHVDVMRSMGLGVLQDRETQRNTRDIVGSNGSIEILAELAIDTVLYRFGGQDVRLFELEIEAKSRKGGRALNDVRKDLLSMFPSELMNWRFGKLVTGRKIERLWKRGMLEVLEGSTLRPSAYEFIERA